MSNQGQCPLCGRVDEDWTAPASKALTATGQKAEQRRTVEDRMLPFRRWHRSLGPGLYNQDIDCLEWRMVNGVIVPVGVIELTRLDGSVPIPQTYLDCVLERMCSRDPQARVARLVAGALDVYAFAVVWRWDCSEFWVYNLTAHKGWWPMSHDRYRQFLVDLHALPAAVLV